MAPTAEKTKSDKVSKTKKLKMPDENCSDEDALAYLREMLARQRARQKAGARAHLEAMSKDAELGPTVKKYWSLKGLKVVKDKDGSGSGE